MSSLARHVVLAASAVTVTTVVIALSGWTPHVGYLAGLGVVAAVASAALRRLGATVAEGRWPSPVARRADAPGVDPRTGALETLLRRSTDDDGTFDRRLRPLLADLATHRLAHDAGIDPSEHPVEARRVLGDGAWHVLTTDGAPSAAELERAIEAIERVSNLGRSR